MTLQDQLRELFLLDQQVRGLRSRLDAAQRRQDAQKEKLDQLQRHREELQQQVRHHETRGNALEQEAGDVEAKADRLREQMNSVKTNKEYSALLVEVNTLKEQKGKLEEQALEHMNQVEQLTQQLEEVSGRLKQQEKLLEQSAGEVQGAQEQVGGKLDEATRERDEAAEKIPAEARQLFNRLAENYDGEAMATIEEADRKRLEYNCAGCYMQLPIERVNALLKRPDELVTCPNCSRILYIDEQTRSAIGSK